MKIRILFILLLISMGFGCSKVAPRRPINPKSSTTILKETLKKSKKLNKVEEDKILKLIQIDSTKQYKVSPNGFWYTYLHKIEKNMPTPKIGDVVSIEYNITDLQDSIIYNKEELGIKNYKVDKENFISGIQAGIKLMKVGETITFVLPSYNAFGISGDGNKIGINQSIKSTVTLINIK